MIYAKVGFTDKTTCSAGEMALSEKSYLIVTLFSSGFQRKYRSGLASWFVLEALEHMLVYTHFRRGLR